MKRIFAIISVALLVAGPLFAQGAVETIGEWTTSLAGAGAGLGAILGIAGGPVGIIIGALAGAVAGGGVGIEVQKEKDEANLTSNESAIEQMELQNKQTAAQSGALRTALATWQNDYDLAISTQQGEAEGTLDTLKQNWGLTNAILGSENREGATARILSEKRRKEAVRFAGEDMELNNDEVLKQVNDVYNDASNFDEEGNITEAGAKKLELIGSNYGNAELALAQTAIGKLQTKKAGTTQLDINQAAITKNNEAITDMSGENDIIKKRQRWMK